MSTLSAGAVLQQARYANFKHKQCSDDASIENTASKALTNNTSIELPAEIKGLITGSDFWVNAKTNRYKKLIREGHLDMLLALAAEARTKKKPANWFAHCASKELWKITLIRFTKYQEKLQAVTKQAAYVAQKLKTTVTKFIYKQIWKGVNVVRWADTAVELRHDKPGQSREKHFAWLCLNEQRLAI